MSILVSDTQGLLHIFYYLISVLYQKTDYYSFMNRALRLKFIIMEVFIAQTVVFNQRFHMVMFE